VETRGERRWYTLNRNKQQNEEEKGRDLCEKRLREVEEEKNKESDYAKKESKFVKCTFGTRKVTKSGSSSGKKIEKKQ